MSDTTNAVHAGNKRNRWMLALALLFTAFVAGLVFLAGSSAAGSQDPLFRGEPESEWIKNLKSSDDAQVKEWRVYGEEGVQVLIRGLKSADHPRERAYRRFRRALPGAVRSR